MSDTHQQLIAKLAEELGPSTAQHLVARLVEVSVKPNQAEGVLLLLDELDEISPKVARAAIESFPDLQRRDRLSDAVSWLDLGIALAGSSGAIGLKYFKESPLVLGLIETPSGRSLVLKTALELAEQDANVALEFLRVSAEAVTVISPDQLEAWLEIGFELTQVDFVVALEYIRQIPAVARVLPIEEARAWATFGMKLISQNSFGKTDYFGTIEFLRTSPLILGDLEDQSVRAKVITVGSLLAERDPGAGIAWLSESPRLLRAVPNEGWRLKILQYGALVAERDADTALTYLRRAPELVAVIGASAEAMARFEAWFTAGMEVLAYSVEGARAYFALESQKALTSVEAALSGVPLRQVARTIKLFVQGLCGTDLTIQALPDSLSQETAARPTVSQDGRTISLPALLRRYPTAEENTRLYLVMAAHEAGHVEFGTYQLTLEPLADVVMALRQKYGRVKQVDPDSLASLFRFYPHPGLIQDLWTLVEDARVEYLLQREYPGLQRDLQQFAREAITTRSLTHGLTVKELVVDQLLQLSTAASQPVAIHEAIKDEIAVLWPMCQAIQAPTATAEEAVRLAHALYVQLEELLAPKGAMIQADQAGDASEELGVGPSASDQTGEDYRPITNWVYRGAMNPEFIRQNAQDGRTADDQQQSEEIQRMASAAGGSQEASSQGQQNRGGTRTETEGDRLAGGRQLPSQVEELLAVKVEQPAPIDHAGPGDRAVRYPEWDQGIDDYRLNWCRVVERAAEEGSGDIVAATLSAHGSEVSALRRFFEGLRPPGLRRVPGQADGDELDVDAAVRMCAERAAGIDLSDRIYVRRERKERDVAAAFLVDVSGSTSRQLGSGRRVIDLEKEGLVLLCEALEAVGDQYALYGYSGQGRGQVDFLVIKDFDDQLGGKAAQRLGGLVPMQQNRDGAAIRHATAKLLAREARTRLLVLISDGRPLDDGYKDEYSLEDTKAALREARQRGVHPFCITIDREADGYVRRMYGDVQFAVIDHLEALPKRLPKIYQRLTT
ncbi:MAG: VWA domain-containing protein [Nitrospirota bacterium]|nr:VWA domain-containing protein [Nitrospirota bacterium]MDP3595742.1 VWA domain-containing protein [Nitrospirota bacterium]